MNITEFKLAVAGFVGRDPQYFKDNPDGSAGPDKLLIAINNAKIFLQRQIDFEYAREFVDFTYYTTIGTGEGIDLRKAVLHDSACSVNVKKVTNLYTPHGFARLLPLRQKTFRGVSDMVRGGYERGAGRWLPEQRPFISSCSPLAADRCWTAVWGHTFRDPVYYQHGRKLLLYPKPNGFDEANQNTPSVPDLSFVGDVVAYLPPYSEPTNGLEDDTTTVDGKPLTDPYLTDFILDDCYDYMLWRAVAELNVFLKDDDQIGISQSKMTEALENIRAWNADLINAGYDIE